MPIKTTLTEMGWPQPSPTPLQVDNSTAAGIANDTVKQQRSKAIDMHFYWLCDRIKQGQFHVYWPPAATNMADETRLTVTYLIAPESCRRSLPNERSTKLEINIFACCVV